MIGDGEFTLVCVVVCIFVSLPLMSGWGTVELRKSGPTGKSIIKLADQREAFYAYVYKEYYVRFAVAGLLTYFLFKWAGQDDQIQETLAISGYLRDTILTPEWLGTAVVAFYAKKIITAVVLTETAVVCYCRTEKRDGTASTRSDLEEKNVNKDSGVKLNSEVETKNLLIEELGGLFIGD